MLGKVADDDQQLFDEIRGHLSKAEDREAELAEKKQAQTAQMEELKTLQAEMNEKMKASAKEYRRLKAQVAAIKEAQRKAAEAAAKAKAAAAAAAKAAAKKELERRGRPIRFLCLPGGRAAQLHEHLGRCSIGRAQPQGHRHHGPARHAGGGLCQRDHPPNQSHR